MKLPHYIFSFNIAGLLPRGAAVFLLLAIACNPAELPDEDIHPSAYFLQGELDGETLRWSQDNDSSFVFTSSKTQLNNIVLMENKMGGTQCQGECANSFQFSFVGQETLKQNDWSQEDMIPAAAYRYIHYEEQDTGLFCQIIPQAIQPLEYTWNYGFGKPLVNQDFYWKIYGYGNNQICLRSTFAQFQDPMTYTTNFDMAGNNVEVALRIMKLTATEITVEAITDQTGPVEIRWSNGVISTCSTFSLDSYNPVYNVEATNQQGLSTKVQFAVIYHEGEPFILYQPFSDKVVHQLAQSAKGKVSITYIDPQGKAWSTTSAKQYASNELQILKVSPGPLNEHNKPTLDLEVKFNGFLQDGQGNKKQLKNFTGRIAVGRPD